MTEFRVESKAVGDDWELRVEGELDAATAPQFSAALDTIPKGSSVVLALDHLMFLDSSGLRALLRARLDGRDLHLANPRPPIMRVLEIADVLDLLPLLPGTN